jgi:hypothetical protein
MNIKSLLLGSAAALVAVSGARAADAIVIAEPEPMEYVRICDVYGTGFFYIPGTETCLKFDGYFRFDVGGGEWLGRDTDGDGEGDTYKVRMRSAFRWDARSETEFGTLQGYAHVNFDYDNNYGDTLIPVNGGADAYYADDGGANIAINHAWIDLAGFRMGKSDTYFDTITGYSSNVSNDGTLVSYGPFDTQFISYTFTGGDGFTATVSLENGSGFANDDQRGGGAILDYMPHVVGGFAWTQGWGGISAVGAYDSVREQGAFKARLDINATDTLSLYVEGGYSTNTAGNAYATWGGDYMIFTGGSWQMTEKAQFNLEVAYDDFENFHTVANVSYEIVPGFRIIPEIVYVDNFDNANDFNDSINGFVRFQRNF